MRTYDEVRLIVFKYGVFTVKTASIVVADWPSWEHAGWKILTIDPEDDTAYVYWTHQGSPELTTLI